VVTALTPVRTVVLPRCRSLEGDIHSYSSFSQAADENAASRIYIGIHFRKAVETGVHHGRRIAAYAVHQFVKPVQ
jgi:hypothetical protein